MANPIVACYAAHLSRDWARFYIHSLIAVERLLKTTLLRRPGEFYVPEILERWMSIPIRRSGQNVKVYTRLSEVLRLTVAWLADRRPGFLSRLRTYLEVFDGAGLMPPDNKTKVFANRPDQRDWTLYRWNASQIIVAVLAGPNPLAVEISTDNFPKDLQNLEQKGKTLIALLKIPHAVFPRYQIWAPQRDYRGTEDPWFALNFLGSSLSQRAITRKRIKRLSSLELETFAQKDSGEWWDHVASRLPSVDFSLLDVTAQDFAEKEDMGGYLTAFFPDAKLSALGVVDIESQ